MIVSGPDWNPRVKAYFMAVFSISPRHEILILNEFLACLVFSQTPTSVCRLNRRVEAELRDVLCNL